MPTISIDISPEFLGLLERKAKREDTTIDDYLVQHVQRLVAEGRYEETAMARDPLYRLGPAHRSRAGDLGRLHDQYLYGIERE